MTASGISLVDANIWLAIAVNGHIHHSIATDWFDGQDEGKCAFCRIIQMALLRHLTNPKIMGEANVQTQIEAWRAYEALTADPRIVFLDEPSGINGIFKSLTHMTRPAHKLWTDAYLAAFAIGLGLEAVTFDADFTRFPGVSVRLLKP